MLFVLYALLQLQFLEQAQRNNPAFQQRMYHGNDDKKNFVLPEDYDQTPKEPERWDQRILDVDVARLMRMVIHPQPSKEFAKEAPEMADDFYTMPYCKVAQEQFGYEGHYYG